MSKKETAKRYILFVISLFFMGLGIAMTKHAELGVSPISSVANVVSIKFTFLSFGTWLMIFNFLMIFGQVVLLRKNFKPIQLLQIPISLIFGYFTDLGMLIVGKIPNEIYLVKLALVFGGIIVLGFGITLGVIANVVLNSGEAFVKAIADVAKKDFGNTKIVFDVSWVLFSVVLSMIFFKGKVIGTREGTLISAVCLGFVIKFFRPLLQKPLESILTK